MNPKTFAILKTLIETFEGCKLKAYRCPANIPTIGYGKTGSDVTMGMTCTQEQADAWLAEDMNKYYKLALGVSPTLLQASPERTAAIVDFVYNVGIGAYKVSKLLLAVNAGDWHKASTEILKWDHAKVNGVSKVLPGLTKRRKAESALLWR